MFERIKYHYSAGYSFASVELWVKNNELHYSKTITGNPEEFTQDSVSEVSVEDFAKMIETVHIADWKKKYKYDDSKGVILGGESWDVVYKDSDGTKIKSSGDNALPVSWGMLQKVLTKTVGTIEFD